MLRQLASRMVGRASASASSSSLSPLYSSSSSSSCSSTHAVHQYSYSPLRSFSSSSDNSHSSPPASSSKPSSASDIPPNFYQNPYGENLNLFSEELTWSGHSKYLIPGPFGTMESPAIVYSEQASRIVGCTGGDGLPHQLHWFILKRGHKHVCQDCGQVFLLQTPPVGNESSIAKWIEGQYGLKPEDLGFPNYAHDHGHVHEHDAHDDHGKDAHGKHDKPHH